MLKDDSAVSALVGTRIYPELAEEGAATPYVVYSVVSNTPVDTKDSAPVDEAQLEVFSVADTYAAANDLADKVRTALSRKSKTVYKTATVQSVKYTNEVTEVSAERNLFISVQDYTVRLTPALATPLTGLLDTYANAAAAFSLRKLSGNYTGHAIKVRRESDNATLDIGFNLDNLLDTYTLTEFCRGTNGYVHTWYNQANSANDAVATDNGDQPQIVENGSVITGSGNQDGLPAIKSLPGDLESGSVLFLQSALLNTGDYGVYTAATVSLNDMLYGGTSPVYGLWFANSSQVKQRFGNPSTELTLSYSLSEGDAFLSYQNRAGNDAELAGNGGVAATTTLVDDNTLRTDRILAGNGSDSFNYGRLIFEMVFYESDQSANRTGIESNINTHYSIY